LTYVITTPFMIHKPKINTHKTCNDRTASKKSRFDRLANINTTNLDRMCECTGYRREKDRRGNRNNSMREYLNSTNGGGKYVRGTGAFPSDNL